MRIFIIFISLFFIGSLNAQSVRDSLTSWNFTISPSALYNVYPGAQIGLEKGVNGLGYFELEGAYLFPMESNLDISRHGFRLKFSYKLPIRDEALLTFIFFYRKTYHERTENFSRFGDAFFQQIDFTKTKTLIGPTIGYANSTTMFSKVKVEYGVSFGLGSYRVRDEGVPEDAEQVSGIPIFSAYEEAGNHLFPIISLQTKFKFGS